MLLVSSLQNISMQERFGKINFFEYQYKYLKATLQWKYFHRRLEEGDIQFLTAIFFSFDNTTKYL